MFRAISNYNQAVLFVFHFISSDRVLLHNISAADQENAELSGFQVDYYYCQFELYIAPVNRIGYTDAL